jgi:hypothetical protein
MPIQDSKPPRIGGPSPAVCRGKLPQEKWLSWEELRRQFESTGKVRFIAAISSLLAAASVGKLIEGNVCSGLGRIIKSCARVMGS